MKNNIFLPILLLVVNFIFLILTSIIENIHLSETISYLMFFLELFSIFIISPILIMWQIYNIYKWIVKNNPKWFR